MKFIVFNIIVAAALIYLATDRFGGAADTVPPVSMVSETAEPQPERLAQSDTSVLPTPAPAAEAKPAAVAPVERDAAVPPVASVAEAPEALAQVVDAPVIAAADLVSQSDTIVAETPPPLDLAVARRRAQVLDEPTSAAPPPAQPAAERRQQLLDLAEEMEFLAAEFAAR